MTTVYGNDAASIDAIDAEFLLRDNVDPTKILNLQVSGLTTGTTRTLTIPDADGTIALTSGIPAAGIVSIDGVANAGGDVDLVAGSTKVSITPDDALNKITLDVNEANLTLSNIGGAVTDAQVPNTITLDNITQVTTRSHTSLSDIGTNTHPQIDTHIAGAILGSGTANKVSKFTAIRTVADSIITDNGTDIGIGTAIPGAKLHVEAPSSPYGQLRILSTGTGAGITVAILIGRTEQTNEQRWLLGQGVGGINDTFGIYTGGSPRLAIQTDGNVGIGTTLPTSKLQVVGLPVHADNAAAITAGLTAGAFYRTTAGVLMVVF